MNYRHITLYNPVNLVNTFAKYFGTNFSNTILNADDLLKFVDYSSNTTVHISSVGKNEVLEALQRVKSNFTSGHDNIPGFFLNDRTNIFDLPLSNF